MTFYKTSIFLFSVFSDTAVHIFKTFFSNLILKYVSFEVKAGFLNELWLREMTFKGIMINSSTGIGHAMTETQRNQEKQDRTSVSQEMQETQNTRRQM